MPPLPAYPEMIPFPAELSAPDTDADSQLSFCTIDSFGGPGVTLWSDRTSPTPRSDARVQLQLAPDDTVIIGRLNGGEIDYLDPRFVPTPIIPGTGTTILRHGGAGRDVCVSRGHFMLCGHSRGILFVNGVPRRGGGIRAPRQWTELLLPQRRILNRGEQVLIERGADITIRLPNETRLTIRAS
jgi:hypothetical protein